MLHSQVEERWGFAGTHLPFRRNYWYSRLDIGLSEDMLIHFLYNEKNLDNSEYEEKSNDYDDEGYQWDYEQEYYSEYRDNESEYAEPAS